MGRSGSRCAVELSQLQGVMSQRRRQALEVFRPDAGDSARRQRLLTCGTSPSSPRLAPKTVEMGYITNRFSSGWPVPTHGPAHQQGLTLMGSPNMRRATLTLQSGSVINAAPTPIARAARSRF
jgi:hypothetical protein